MDIWTNETVNTVGCRLHRVETDLRKLCSEGE